MTTVYGTNVWKVASGSPQEIVDYIAIGSMTTVDMQAFTSTRKSGTTAMKIMFYR